MTELDTVETIPMVLGADGVIRVGGTRVTLDTLIAAFREGETPEEIAQQYPPVALGDIYAVIGYALRHPDTVSVYLRRRSDVAKDVRTENERRFSADGIRDRLLARRLSQRGT
ncbi:conserved hypothetical protein [Candidatus Sulfopaludibacter sp. SbA4]|nr:conserved hypothetical protein [Candidatus Sulfopaludibacter sp. SbA4]